MPSRSLQQVLASGRHVKEGNMAQQRPSDEVHMTHSLSTQPADQQAHYQQAVWWQQLHTDQTSM